jgi:hypothetical protein
MNNLTDFLHGLGFQAGVGGQRGLVSYLVIARVVELIGELVAHHDRYTLVHRARVLLTPSDDLRSGGPRNAYGTLDKSGQTKNMCLHC